jgi:hypothetical protein
VIQAAGDPLPFAGNSVKNKKTRRQPWAKKINGRQTGKKQKDKKTTLGKNN